MHGLPARARSRPNRLAGASLACPLFMPSRCLALVAWLASAACVAAARIEDIRLPTGFQISVYAENVKGARSLALGERGTLFVGSSGGSVYAIPPGGGAARVVASGLQAP